MREGIVNRNCQKGPWGKSQEQLKSSYPMVIGSLKVLVKVKNYRKLFLHALNILVKLKTYKWIFFHQTFVFSKIILPDFFLEYGLLINVPS